MALNKHICVVDFGKYTWLAQRLTKHFDKVSWFNPWVESFPKSNLKIIGTLPELNKIDYLWDEINNIDMFLFPDVYMGDMQEHLRELGKNVWGAGKGEELEIYRREAKAYLNKIGVNVPKGEVVKGTAELRKYLKENEDVFIKLVNGTRGDTETFYSKNYNSVETYLDRLDWELGAVKMNKEFIVEPAINDAIEIGYDGYCIDGMFPKGGWCGIEIKDKGYLNKFWEDENDMPEQLIETNRKLMPFFREYGYKQMWSTEERLLKDGTTYFMDATCRFPRPPSEIMTSQIKNLAEVLYRGSQGELVDPKVDELYGAELCIYDEWCRQNWQPIEIPEHLWDYVCLSDLVQIEGKYYVLPQNEDNPEIGTVMATGKSKEEAIEKVTKYAKELCDENKDFTINCDVLEDANEKIAELKKWGVELV